MIDRFVLLVARRQSEFSWDLSILAFMALVLSVWLWAATSNPSVSFFRYPVLSHDQLFSLAISSISIRNCPCSFLLLTPSILSLNFRLLISLDYLQSHFTFSLAADNILSLPSDTYLARLALDSSTLSSTAVKPRPRPFLGR